MNIDLQTYIDNAIKAQRRESLSKSDQLTVGEILLKLEPILKRQPEIIEKYDHEATVMFDFEYLFPVDIDSWRGSYSELALEFSGYGGKEKPMSVTEFYNMIKGVIGSEFTGWKGGEFTMDKHTPVWVANPGHSGNTAVIDIIDNEYEVLVMTGYREF